MDEELFRLRYLRAGSSCGLNCLPMSGWVPQTPPRSMQQSEALGYLRQMLGPAAEFRDGQWEAIDLAANRRERLLVVQRTGWGKSVVYFLATKILRASG